MGVFFNSSVFIYNNMWLRYLQYMYIILIVGKENNV